MRRGYVSEALCRAPIRELGDVRSNLDHIILYWRMGMKLKRITCSHVDNFFYGRDSDFERLEVGCKEKVNFKYIKIGIRQEKEGVIMS